MDTLLTSLSGNSVIKVGTAILTVLLVIPAVLKLFVITIDEGWAAIRTRNGRPIIRHSRSRSSQRGKSAPITPSAGEVVVLRPGSHGAFPMFFWYRLVDVRWRATDLPVRQLTGRSGHQHLVQASFEWRPVASGRDLRVFELDVANVTERTANIIGAALRDVVRRIDGADLPDNAELSDRVLAECGEHVRDACGVEILRVALTGDALTDGYLLSQALRRSEDPPPEAEALVTALHALG